MEFCGHVCVDPPCRGGAKERSKEPLPPKTMKGALPPSSIEVRLTVSADCAISSLPTAVEPVKESFRT